MARLRYIIHNFDTHDYMAEEGEDNPPLGTHVLQESIFVSKEEFSEERDLLEYPDGRIPPEPGQVVAIYGKNKEIARKYSTAFMGHLKKIQPDFDNDGLSEDVIIYSSRTRYRDGDMFFIYPARKSPKLELAVNSENEIKSGGVR